MSAAGREAQLTSGVARSERGRGDARGAGRRPGAWAAVSERATGERVRPCWQRVRGLSRGGELDSARERASWAAGERVGRAGLLGRALAWVKRRPDWWGPCAGEREQRRAGERLRKGRARGRLASGRWTRGAGRGARRAGPPDRWGRGGRCARRELVHARRWRAAAAGRCRWGHAGLARVCALVLGRARGEAAVLGRPERESRLGTGPRCWAPQGEMERGAGLVWILIFFPLFLFYFYFKSNSNYLNSNLNLNSTLALKQVKQCTSMNATTKLSL